MIRDLGPRGLIEGEAGERFGPVVDALVANFLQRGDVGAAVSLFVDGACVVDVWGGLADARTERAWTAQTPALVFSCTKGIVAICAYLLVQDGRLDLDAPVVRYWPEFGQQGKAGIPVRWLFSHRAGLLSLDQPLTRAEVLAWDPVIRAIERQAPLWPPGSDHTYHPLTYGWLTGEVIRRITGKTPGAYFREALAAPLGLRAWIGLPAEEREAVACVLPPLPDTDLEAARTNAEMLADPVVARGFTMGGAIGPIVEGDHVTFNDPDIQAAEVPAANGITDARSLARLYAGCVCEIDGPSILSTASIEDALVERSSGRQRLGGPDRGERWGTGFILDSRPACPMLGPRSFGHPGAGGELAFADDERHVGFAYINNQMGGLPDHRANLLVAAVRGCLGD